MYLLSKEGRKHLLEFLRNLTPQVLLLSTFFILLIQGASGDRPVLNYLMAALVACLLAMAISANVENLLDNAISSSKPIAAERDRLKDSETSRRLRVWNLVKYIWSHHKSAFIELILAIAVLYFGLFAVFISALAAARRALG